MWSGFFIKYLIEEKYFYFLMSNEHVITNDLIKNMKCVVKAEEKYVECLEKAPDYPKIP